MHYRDLRGWLECVDSFGELRVIEGADWNQEIGAAAEVAAQLDPPPAVLFDKIKDYPVGAVCSPEFITQLSNANA
jgi:4-hydroxy-3-polyprenylbenzoate decarboxylase